ARFPRPHGDQERPSGAQAPPRQRPQTTDAVALLKSTGFELNGDAGKTKQRVAKAMSLKRARRIPENLCLRATLRRPFDGRFAEFRRIVEQVARNEHGSEEKRGSSPTVREGSGRGN